jgi:uncharacterized protein (DUF885 family)
VHTDGLTGAWRSCRLAAAAALLLALAAPGPQALAEDAAGPDDAALRALADEYLDGFYFPHNPTAATAAGVHAYDDRLEDYTLAGNARQARELRAYLKRVAAFDAARLSQWLRADRELLRSNIQSALLTIETTRPLERNPDSYSSGISTSAYAIMQREFAPPAQRLRELVARERQMPAALAGARSNLANPPRIYTEIALEQLPGIIGLFATDLPAAFAGAGDAPLQAEFAAANGAVIEALREYQQWLKRELLARSHGDFRLHAPAFRAKLAAEEMVDTPLDRLLAIGIADLRRNQAEFARIAHQLEPGKSARQVLAEIAADHPAPGALLDSFRATFDGLTAFIEARQLISIPPAPRPIVRETPPFMRATTSASMDTPGPFETVAQEAYFSVTLPEATWDAQRTGGFMSQFNYPVISNTSVHETYPGHYVQFLWVNRNPDRLRRVLGANSNAEGWAHYCEQLLLDEGYGQPGSGAADERAALRLRLGQLIDALLRDARYVVGIRMHTQGMTIRQGIDYFVREGYQPRELAEAETKRGTSDPTYLYYTLGKLQIQKLRADVAAREGAAFSLRDFHDRLMQQGFPPIKLVRRALLHDDSPPL